VYVWDVNSTVTKHSLDFVWKDTSERVVDAVTTPVHKKRVILFYRGSSETNKSPKPLGNTLCDVLLLSRFQSFAACAKKKIETVLWAVLINSLIVD